MPRIIEPVVSPRGRVIVLTGATLWLIAAMLLSATPEGASATPRVRLPESSLVDAFDHVDGAPGLLSRPRLHTDANGHVYIVDRGGYRVIRTTRGEERRADVIYGREGAGPGELKHPWSVAVDSSGNVFVTDLQLQRLLKYAPDGTFLRSVGVPRVISVIVDSDDRVVVRTGRNDVLLQRYSNDLDEDGALLARADSQHTSPLGVLMVIDDADRIFLLDQSDLTVKVYDRDMRPVDQWQLDPPQLQKTVAMRLAAARARFPDGGATIDGVQSMALDPSGRHLLLVYLVTPSSDVRETNIAWYRLDGTFEKVEERGAERIFANAILPDGTILEGTAEHILVRSIGTTTSNTNVENN